MSVLLGYIAAHLVDRSCEVLDLVVALHLSLTGLNGHRVDPHGGRPRSDQSGISTLP